jgi:hypothetical protein
LLPVCPLHSLSTVFVGQSSLMYGAVDCFAPGVVLQYGAHIQERAL